MPNKNYNNGRAKEYRIVNHEKSLGRLAFRTAGSHSPIDVVSINTKNMIIKLIQSKPKSMSDNQKEKILKELKKYEGFYIVEVEVV